jgi:hypothetical protein
MDIVLGHYLKSGLITELDSQIQRSPYGQRIPYGKPANVASVLLPDNANRQFRVLQKIIGAMWLDYYKNPTDTPFTEFYKRHDHFFFLCLLPYYNNLAQLIENAIKLALLPCFFESELDKHNATYPDRKHSGDIYSYVAFLVFGKEMKWSFKVFEAAAKKIFEENPGWSTLGEKYFNKDVEYLTSSDHKLGPNCPKFVSEIFDEVLLSNEGLKIQAPLKRAFTSISNDGTKKTHRMPIQFFHIISTIEPLKEVNNAIISAAAAAELKNKTDDIDGDDSVTSPSVSSSSPSASAMSNSSDGTSSPSSPGKKRMSPPSESSERGKPRLGGSTKRRHATYRKIKKYKTTRKRLRK